jgi:hypothetical protein
MPARFLKTAYHDDDRIVIAYRRLPSRDWHHRFVIARNARAPRFLAYLRYLNAQRHDIYVSMNAFGPRHHGRTEANVVAIRHIYVEFDSGGAPALAALRARPDLPPLSYVVHSSPGKFQAIWNVCDFEPAAAKRLLRHLAYELGADHAVHDLNRVLRLPGLFNYKYKEPPFVRLEIGECDRVYPPSAFPTPRAEEDEQPSGRASRPRAGLPGTTHATSRSEQDWAFVRTGLARGERWETLWAALIRQRQDKSNPRYYAALTMIKALKSRGEAPSSDLVAELRAAKTHSAGPLPLPAVDIRA